MREVGGKGVCGIVVLLGWWVGDFEMLGSLEAWSQEHSCVFGVLLGRLCVFGHACVQLEWAEDCVCVDFAAECAG